MDLDWAKLFDGKEHLTPDEFKAALKATDWKLVDLNEGEYVGKGKFEDAAKAHKKALKAITDERDKLSKQVEESESDDSELAKQVKELTKGLETASKDIKAADAKALKLEREKSVSAKVTDKNFARLAYMDASALVNDDTDFEAALAKVLEDNPDYLPGEDGDDEPAPKIRTGGDTKGKPKQDDKLEAAFEDGIEASVGTTESKDSEDGE